MYKMAYANQVWFLNGTKPNTYDHQNTKHVQFLTSHCIVVCIPDQYSDTPHHYNIRLNISGIGCFGNQVSGTVGI